MLCSTSDSHNELLHFNKTVKLKYRWDTCHPFAGLGWQAHLQSLILFLLITVACLLFEGVLSR